MTAVVDEVNDVVSRPLVLIVEDRPGSLSRRRALFESFACTAVGADSKTDAIRELENSPRVDLVLTDIHMPENGDDPDDMSGVILAKYVRKNYEGVPVAGYSAYFQDEEIPSSDLAVFDLVLPKLGQRTVALQEQVQQCVALAIQARERRSEAALDRIDELKLRHEVAVPPLEVKRRLELDITTPGRDSFDAALSAAGYRLRLVSGTPFGSSDPIVVWISPDLAGGFFVEVYGRPDLYAYGKTEQQALDLLAELGASLHDDVT